MLRWRCGCPPAPILIAPRRRRADVYGWDFNNTRLWADKLAKAGFITVLPDFFHGVCV